MIAMLDTWERPQYCTRIWTVFEQYTAAKLRVPVKMILPPAQVIICVLAGEMPPAPTPATFV